jgi:hypothetical protein
MTERDYLALYLQTDPRFCSVEELGDLQNEGDLTKAIPMAERLPNGLQADLAQCGGDMITDFVDNIFRILIVSQKARSILEDEGTKGDQVEYLPIALRDKRQKPLKEPFFVVNLLRTIDCFDWKRSVYKTYKGCPREISSASLRVLHVLPEAIPEDAKLFRLGELRREIILRADLLERLKREGCDGLSVIEMGKERI